ncbi:related to BNA4 - kynurenine 3-mono oxygenase [Melanopsichium pennsylvanicum]|uniref:Kynurenine 3-monooxygenase n=2 Tax=Melanopsichium pennsylvanicum TaxID=63383 RepID=A0AAJ5C5B5_9BASI|nr:related to BNA4-kynurenine 3-mono oxygenase [Melanopsichium pennsylvanicum 4]SNX84556.1 related to BNA4 - kynurenine 3-mono oxygenase [Melanopsichium pennsylvanicum]
MSITPSRGQQDATSSVPASNSLLDLLAGAPGRITSPPSSNTSTHGPLAPSQTLSFPSPSSSTTTISTTPISSGGKTSTNMPSSSQHKQPHDVSHLMQQFMAPSSPLVILSPNSKSAERKDPISNAQTQQPPVLQNKALQLPPSPPSSVSSATGNKLRQPSSGLHSPLTDTTTSRENELSSSTTFEPSSTSAVHTAASASVNTPFDFVTPFDMLSKRDDDATPQPASAQPNSVPPNSSDQVSGYEAASAGLTNLLQKLSASAALKPPQKPATSPEPTSSATSAAPAEPSKPKELAVPPSEQISTSSTRPATASTSSSPIRPAIRKLPSQPEHLDTPDKQFHASRHAAALKQDDAFDDPKSSGLSVLSPSRSTSAPSIATLDLAAQQPGGLSSLRHTKVDISGVALISSPFHFPCNVSAAGLLPASRIANLGHHVACYAMSKGKIRLIHVGTGPRLLVRTPAKAAVRSIATYASSENNDTFLLAALTERSKEALDEGVVFWRVPSSFVLQGKEGSEPTLLGRITADPNKSPFVYRFTAIAWHPTEPKLAISTSDNNVVVVDISQQLIHQHAPSSPSNKLRSLSESDVDPRSKDVAHNEPLAGFAFSPDGSMLATISAPLEGDISWILGFKPLDGSSAAAENLTFLIRSPLQESMIISHLSFITGVSRVTNHDGDVIRGVLVGFRCNTILGVYDLASRSWKHVWKFQIPPKASAQDKEHFNLVHLDVQNSTLLVCNSFRSSILSIPLELQPLPPTKVSLPDRLANGLLPWSIQLSYPIKEYALQDPCTSISISALEGEPSRLFVAFPDGISVLRLLPVDPEADKVAVKPTSKAVEQQKPAETKTDAHAESAPDSVTESPVTHTQATPSKSRKKKNKKNAAAKAQAEDGPDESEPPSEQAERFAEATITPPVVPAAPEITQNSRSQAPTPANQDLTPIPALPSLYEAPTPTLTPSMNTQATLSPKALTSALVPTIKSVLHEVISSNIALSFDRAIENAIPKEVERLISSTQLKVQLTNRIAETILPSVQRTAMEVVSRVLAPHFEEVMMQVSDRVERAIVSEITSVKKSLVAEQNESLDETQKAVRAVQSQISEVLKQMKDFNENKVVEVKDDESVRAYVNGRSAVSTDESTELETPSAKSRSVPAPGPVQVGVKANQDVGNVVHNDSTLAPARITTKCALPERIAIIGAGPVGCLAGLAFAQRGCRVDIFESRPDPRTHEAVARASQRSINLALSTRGITGLRSVNLVGLGKYTSRDTNLADLVLQDSVPMRARMIHVVTKKASQGKDAEVKEVSQLYSNKGEAINSVDRGRLNNVILDHALMHPNVRVHFEHKLQSVDFDHDSRSSQRVPVKNGTAKKPVTGAETSANESMGKGKKPKRSTNQQQLIKSSNAPTNTTSAFIDRVKLEFDVHSTNQKIAKTSTTHFASFVVGCDGAHSSIRSAMGSLIRMHYTHNYIDTGYVELSIPPRTSLVSGSRLRGSAGADGKPGGHDAFHLDPNHLHIWPRHSFMLIALPNLDGSFTCTLFAPFKMFADELGNKDTIVDFFEEHFPDALPLIGQDKLIECLTTRRASALGSVQCDPYHYKDRAVLIGDAAHAMLPFYGQGLNCGFEDVRVLFDIIDKNTTLESALDQYTEQRHPDLKAILQLAEQNYREMAHSVVSWPYLLRKKLDALLISILPSSMWNSLYAMTTFSNLPYSQVIHTEKRQQVIIGNAVLTIATGLLTGVIVGVYRTRSVWQPVTKGWVQGLQKKA